MPTVLPSPTAPGGNYYVTGTQATAQAWSATVDAAQGYPKAGTDVGGGIHVPPDQSVTQRYGPTYQHPTLSQWAYLADAVTIAALLATAGKPVPIALDVTWVGATAITP